MSKKNKQQPSQKKQLQGNAPQIDETVTERTTEVAEPSDDSAVNAELQQSADYSPEEVKQLVDEIVATPKPRRVWEVDFLRGFMILFVVWDHLMWDIVNWGPYTSQFFNSWYEFAKEYSVGLLNKTTHDAFVTLFVFTSGVSCSFSRSNGRRAIKMVSFALLFTAVTFALSAIIQQPITIYFNVIHVIALSVLLWTAIEWLWSKCNKNWQKNIFGVTMFAVIMTALVVGYCARVRPWTNENPAWFFLAMHSGSVPKFNSFWTVDYLPFFPDFGWFLIGAFLGRVLYKERKSIFPSVNEKWVSPITFCGRHSIWIYFGSQVFMAGLLMLLKEVIKCI